MKFSRPRKIFIVDDDPMVAEALKDYLTRRVPHYIRTFSTGEELLKNMSDLPEIIVLDYYLDSEQKNAANGMEILSGIKKNYPPIHVIMLSAQENYGTAIRTIQRGAEQYVIKGEDAFETIADLIEKMD